MDRWLSKEEEELVLNNQGLIRYLVNQFNPKPSEFEDMCQIAEIGQYADWLLYEPVGPRRGPNWN